MTRSLSEWDIRTLVVAARAGNRGALDDLLRRHLPLVYNLARQAIGPGPDVDDVVQDIMLRALRQLPALRSADSFRPWLAAIAVRQIGTHLARADASARRTAALDEVIGRPDAGADVEGPALIRAELATQRRQVRHAARWLAAEDRTLLSLWWLETAGELSRTETAAALGVSVAHAGVRIQRMGDQLELSRSIVAALEAVPGCDRLGAVVADWNGVPGSFWRKRIARHTRSCPVCARAADGMIATDRLLAGLVLFPVPAALTAAVLTKGTFGGTAAAVPAAASKGWFLKVVGAHPVATSVTAAAAVALAVAAVTAIGLSTPDSPAPAVIAAPPDGSGPGTGPASSRPSAAPDPLKPRQVSLQSPDAGGKYVTVGDAFAALAVVGPTSNAALRGRATFRSVPGLGGGADCVSFRAADGRYLRHQEFRLRLSQDDRTVLFRRDATFCPRNAATAGAVTLESFNYRGFYLRHVGNELWVDQSDGSAGFRATSTFVIRPPLA